MKELSNGKRMDIERVIRTVLDKNPGIKAKFLIEKLREKTGLSRSTIYSHLDSLKLREKIYREKGRYWAKKPEDDKGGIIKSLIDVWNRRSERKQVERERQRQERLAPSLAHFRYRAEVDGNRFWKYIVDEEDNLLRKKKLKK